jgi:hypothetical protein
LERRSTTSGRKTQRKGKWKILETSPARRERRQRRNNRLRQQQILPDMWEKMFGAAILGILYPLCHLVLQGLCINIGCSSQKPATTSDRDSNDLVACRLFLSFSEQINAKFKNLPKRMNGMEKKTQ